MTKTAQNSSLLEKAQSLKSRISEIRRRIHSNPELSFQENKTARLAADELSKLGYSIQENVGGTGVVAEMGSGKTIIIRADMDALPINEENKTDYCSRNSGVMHACGHDVHVATAIGAAMLIAEAGPDKGRIRFLFQPAEETINENGKSGATLMIEDGATTDAEGVIALHVDPRLKTGTVAVKEGPLLAACDSFDVKIKGRGTHGAYPQSGIDAIILATNVIQTIQTIVSRRKSALKPAVITVGGIRSTTYRPNIVAEEVEFTGTARYFDKSIHELIKSELERALSQVESLGGSYELAYHHDTPALVNDPALTDLVENAASALLGKQNVQAANLEMGADDFSFLTAHMPSCYFLLGVQIDGSPRQLHTSTFDINEDALPVGAAVLAQAALNHLELS